MNHFRLFAKSAILGLIVVAVLSVLIYAQSLGPKKPNIILIAIDTLRADHLGCYGYARETSPNIDAFVKDAVLFENAFSQASVTAPAFMSIFTSLTPAVHKVGVFKKDRVFQPLHQQVITLPMILKRNGYSTIGLHGGGEVSENLGFDRGFDSYRKWWRGDEGTDFQILPQKIDDVRRAIRESKAKGKPLFLFLHHYFCHDPYLHAPEIFCQRFLSEKAAGLPTRPTDIVSAKTFKTNRENFWKNVDMSNPKHRSHIIALYDGGAYYSDHIFGELIKLLEEEKYYDNSVIIVVADHGEEFYEHSDKLHWRLFIETLHVPLIVKFPHSEYRGKVIRERVRTFDILPTLIDFLKLKTDHFMQGISFLPLLTGQDQYAPLIVSYAHQYDPESQDSIRFISNGFVYSNQPSAGTDEWLFDAVNDPKEMNNLASSHPVILKQMRKIAQDELEKDKEIRERLKLKKGAPVEKDEQLLDQLKSLGYVQ
jgi:arylsulfatase A-like enzyme